MPPVLLAAPTLFTLRNALRRMGALVKGGVGSCLRPWANFLILASLNKKAGAPP